MFESGKGVFEKVKNLGVGFVLDREVIDDFEELVSLGDAGEVAFGGGKGVDDDGFGDDGGSVSLGQHEFDVVAGLQGGALSGGEFPDAFGQGGNLALLPGINGDKTVGFGEIMAF